MSYGTIYKITNIKTGKVHIGKTTRSLNDRLQGHINSANKGDNFKLSRAIRKYGKENFIIEPIDFADTRKELNEKEVYYISEYDSLETGYNMTIGGEGGNTYIDKSDEEMKAISEKISAALRKNNGNHGQFVGPKNGMYGKHQTPEAKEKISKASKGRKFSKEHNRKISEYYKGRKKHYLHPHTKLFVTNIETDEICVKTAKEIVTTFDLQNYIALKNIVDNKTILNKTFIISKSVSTSRDECSGG
jgi:group I intron endonuclease